MSLVAAVKTPIADEDLIQALRSEWASQMGGPPSNASIAVLCAQVALETGHGQSCICWNIGNSKAYAGVDNCEFKTVEFISGQPVSMTSAFAAYASLADGVAFYLHSMWNRWTKAWPSVVAGDPKGFAQGLHDQGYYTAPVQTYCVGVERWFAFYMSKLGGDKDVTEPDMPVTGVAFILPEPSSSDPVA